MLFIKYSSTCIVGTVYLYQRGVCGMFIVWYVSEWIIRCSAVCCDVYCGEHGSTDTGHSQAKKDNKNCNSQETSQ